MAIRKENANINGDIKPTGLSTALKTTTMNIGDTAVKLPATALANRNAISVHNKDSVETLYIGDSNSVTADSVVGITSGWEIGPQEFINFDITDDIDLYGIAPSGKTILIKVMEIA